MQFLTIINLKESGIMKVIKLVKEYPLLTSLALLTLTVGIAVLIAKAKSESENDYGNYTEFDM
ncbi:MAG TPA: hypothetical protein VES38_08315 [Methylotenera sp.]|nr:hypothetical protein [Methylotenera sp.]